MRYAIYLTPPEGPLLDCAEAWLGRSAVSGKAMQSRAPVAAKAHVPARYGFHATLRAPFHLAAGVDEARLFDAFDAFAQSRGPIHVALTLGRLETFLALVTHESAVVNPVADAAVRAFEPLRAPLSEAERARRNPERLDERGRALLEAWGYPYVMDRFTFHMTLTGPMDSAHMGTVEDAAETLFAPLLKAPQPLVLAVFREDARGEPFRVVRTAGVMDRVEVRP
ncbi:MAG: DUF1045 domain-containing protein [Pseudomonadota bacterium]